MPKDIPSRLPNIPPCIYHGYAAFEGAAFLISSPGCIKSYIVAKLFSSGLLNTKQPVMFLQLFKKPLHKA